MFTFDFVLSSGAGCCPPRQIFASAIPNAPAGGSSSSSSSSSGGRQRRDSRRNFTDGQPRTNRQQVESLTNVSEKSGAPSRPKYDMVVVVEGINDMKAVRAAVNADVFVLGTATRAGDPAVHEELRSAAGHYRGILLLLDPDVAGRQARNLLSQALPGCWHAFVAVPAARTEVAVRFKEAGDIGVEHAASAAIRGALKRRRQSVVGGRATFTREGLQSLGLIAEMHERGGNITERRFLVCDFLGIGNCDGKQLLRQLNSYGFQKSDLSEALEWAEQKIGVSSGE